MRENLKAALLSVVLGPRVKPGPVGSAILSEAWGRCV